MLCLNPIPVTRDDFNPESGRFESIKEFVPCGKCPMCAKNDANSWRIRLLEEFFHSQNAYFFTLTYDDQHLSFGSSSGFDMDNRKLPCVSKSDVQGFVKRVRTKCCRCSEVTEGIRFFIVSEYGPTTLRPHYHGIFFNLPKFSDDKKIQIVKICKIIESCWTYGYVNVSELNENRISYVTKYLFTVCNLPEGYVEPFRLMSRRPGIGYGFFDNPKLVDYYIKNLDVFYHSKGFKYKLPRYYYDKLYDNDAKLCIKLNYLESLDKEKFSNFFEKVVDQVHSEYPDISKDEVFDIANVRTNVIVNKMLNKYTKKRKNI